MLYNVGNIFRINKQKYILCDKINVGKMNDTKKRNNNNIYIKILTITTSIISIFIILNLFTFSSEPTLVKKSAPTFKDGYSIFSLKIPNKITFAQEKVPVNKHWVKESLDRELLVNTYWQSQTVLFIKRCNRFFPVIEPILKAQGIPDDFKYLAVIESGLMPRSVSPAGAAGIWQFMSATAKEYGLEVNSEVDERYHLEKATLAACKYFKKSYSVFNNWTLVAASYNAGKRGVSNQLERQKTDNYYDLLLGEETGRYVYRIIALKEILSDPTKYGFYVPEDDLYPQIPTQTISIDSTINNIAVFASSYEISYKELKDLNPWLRDNKLSNTRKKTYSINLPNTVQSPQSKQTLAIENTPIVPIGNTEVKLKKQSLSIQ